MKKFTKILALLLALVMVLSCMAGCKKDPDTDDTKPAEQATYTYRGYTAQLGTNWNPHLWSTEADGQILSYLQTPLVAAVVKDSEKGVYQWAFKAAASITDVTADHKDDLTKYGVTLPAGKTAEQTDSGYVFEIKLNPDMKWENGTAINADTYIYSMQALLAPGKQNTRANPYHSGEAAIAGAYNYYSGKADSYDTVGCYKADELTIRYVTQAKTDYNSFLNACTTNWLVYKDLYEAGSYGTSKETSMSYGPYKIESLQEAKQIVFVQNENYYQFEKKEDGTLYAETDYLVDGENVQAYQTTKIIVDAMTEEAAKEAFLKGELSEWTPNADDLPDYSDSDQIHLVNETDTYAFFFNTDLSALLEMKGSQNAIVLSNSNFRKAFSLSINRRDWVTATVGYAPSYNLINSQYYYDIFNDPTSTYRDSSPAKEAMISLYGLRYVDGTAYETLDDAYNAVTGYDLEEAKKLMKTACDELVYKEMYKAGEEIKLLVAYSDGPLSTSDTDRIEKINQYLNAACEGSGFGKITLEAVGELENYREKVSAGEYAVGYGAWGGDAFAPLENMQFYCDTEAYKVDELGCWDPASEKLIIEVNGEKVTKTWKDWSHALVGTGPYADELPAVKLQIAATMEKEFLAKYYRIPLAAGCTSFLQSYQVKNYADTYNVMYGFGGLELMTYSYSDAQWAEYVADEGGTLSYE